MRNKRILHSAIAVLAAAMIAGLAGCGQSEQPATATAIVTTSTTTEMTTNAAETTNAETDYKTIAPPKGGWTPELLNEVVYVNGYEVDIPFTLKDIGWDKELIDVTYSEDSVIFSGYLHKDDSVHALVAGLANDEGIYDENSPIYNIIVEIYNFENYKDDKISQSLLKINGLSVGDSVDENIMLNTFGKSSLDSVDKGYFGYNINSIETDFIYVSSKNNIIRTMIIQYSGW
jgi:hypothetical protein